METGSSINFYLNPALSLSIALGKQMEQIRLAQFNMVKQYNEVVSLALKSPYMEIIKNIQDMQNSLAKNLLYALNPFAISHNPITAVEIQEAEIVEENNSMFDLTIAVEGRFFYKNELIDTISTNSKQGRLLKMLLTSDDNYITDEEIIEKLDVSDYRSIGYLRRDLKEALKKFGLIINLYREKQRGYRLLEVSTLPN
ncbi:hypothetical protein A2Z22_01030 [Candidatus Woesebacteria bacterium RBG_16_34_12]|uniref:Uncharacterized protein n=1 Tax=Candidatus Woesebacteria bacterium RBG_16_34_12 TaxID=1802480 RepID=A0A1F7X8Q7_9BACT|nr:MAG: hypothetical protein A2Z22_01030 [Candidatus Woesebacteria bacterium RBG_16_34_12]